MSEVKDANIKLGDSVRLAIQKPNQIAVTTVQGVCEGIRFWKTDELAIQIEGLDDWIYLDNSVTVQVL